MVVEDQARPFVGDALVTGLDNSSRFGTFLYLRRGVEKTDIIVFFIIDSTYPHLKDS